MKLPSAIRRLLRRTDPGIAARDAEIARLRNIKARYDAAQTGDEYKNYWANADALDADSANNRGVRQTLVSRSRYEVGNNGYADGIAQTYATDLIGNAPTLRMQTGSLGFNQMVELTWFLWSRAIQWRRKLWCMAHAKYMDGEAIAVIRRNPRVNHPIKLDVVLYETEQCQTPFLPFGVKGYIDGIKFDDFGNPLWYDILHEHPGMVSKTEFTLIPEQVPADRVLHWFKMRRPGQHRGIPESASTLNTGAAARRWREATLAAAETAADFSAVMKTTATPEEFTGVVQMSSFDIQKRMLTALPDQYELQQLRAEQPTAEYGVFHKSLINEQARPKSMPKNKAMCDSSDYNYASGRLDHQTYYAGLDVDRADCDEQASDPLFQVWFDMAIATFGWLGGNPDAVGPGARIHSWDWPKHRVADVEAEATAIETKLKSGQTFPHLVFTDAGLDFDDEIAKAATSYGVDESELRTRILDVVLPPAKADAAPAPAEPSLAPRLAAMLANGNGKHHG